jgi:NitT/TauT family transport system permease protein
MAARGGNVSVEIPRAVPRGSIHVIGSSLRRVRPIILPIATAAAALLLWQFAVLRLHVPAVILPAPSEIGRQLWRALPILIAQTGPTALDTLSAFAAAAVLGIGLAIVITYSPLLRDTLYPNLVLFQLVPKVALAPLFVIWLGYGSPARVAFATFISFFPVVISAAVGFAGTDPAALRLCRSLTASEWRCFLLVRFPFALPAIFSGLKVAITMAVVGVIIGEFISSQAGLGHYILNAGSRLETADVFAALGTLSVLGVVLYGAVALAEFGVRRVYGRH